MSHLNTADVIVIGGGIIGLTVADRLAGAGRRVVVLDRGTCGAEASWAGAGILSPCSWQRTDELARMHMDALYGYEAFTRDLQERSGIDPQYRRCGALKLIRDAQHMNMARREAEVTVGRTAPDGRAVVCTLDPAEAQALEPRLTSDILGAQHCRLSSQVRNPRLLRAVRTAAQRRGVHLVENSAVHRLVLHKQRVTGVHATHGTISAALTVVCAGAWSAELDPAVRAAAPTYPVRGQMLLLRMTPAPFQCILQDGNFYMVARIDDHLLVGATEEHESGFSRRTTAQGMAELSRQALTFVPCLGDAVLLRTWAGLRPGTPDRRPVMGFVPETDGLLVCTGHFRTGLTMAPVAAQIVADLAERGACSYDLARCAPGRFGRGSIQSLQPGS